MHQLLREITGNISPSLTSITCGLPSLGLHIKRVIVVQRAIAKPKATVKPNTGVKARFPVEMQLYGLVALFYIISIGAVALLQIISVFIIPCFVFCNGYSVVCRSEEHTSELKSLMRISYAVFCL